MRIGLTPYQAHKAKWDRGCGSEMCDRATSICLARGEVPCDVLFIGEAPGEVENARGRPFIGPAGRLLDSIIETAVMWKTGEDGEPPRVALTNMVGCIPRDEGLNKTGEPESDQVEACRPRLEEFIREVARPRLIVCVGSLARDRVKDQGFRHSIGLNDPPPKVVSITHPAAILRMNIVQRGLEVERCEVVIANALEDL